MKQTAVDYLWNDLIEHPGNYIKAYQIAKQMEKEQIIDFVYSAVRKILDEDRQTPFNLEQYYNETFKSK